MTPKHKQQKQKQINGTTLKKKKKTSAQQKNQQNGKVTSRMGGNIYKPYTDKQLIYEIYKEFMQIDSQKNK